MRGVAIAQEWTLSFSVDGSLTVVMMGAVAGLVGAIIVLTLRSIPHLLRPVRVALFWAAAAFIAARIIQPIDRDRVMMFTPVVLLYGLAQQWTIDRLGSRLQQARKLSADTQYGRPEASTRPPFSGEPTSLP